MGLPMNKMFHSLLLTLSLSTTTSYVVSPQPRSIVPIVDRARAAQDSSSVLFFYSATATPAAWQALVPRPWENPRGLDSCMEWTHESPTQVVEQWTRHWPMVSSIMRQQLEQSLTAFTTAFPHDHYRARLVATCGAAGAKCPQWHVDHVPVRWIQALVGPGVEWVSDSQVDWSKVNALDDDDKDLTVEERNRLLVASDAGIHSAAEGEAVALVGNGWADHVGSYRPPAVHKSPSPPLPWQGRVLLTMDVVID